MYAEQFVSEYPLSRARHAGPVLGPVWVWLVHGEVPTGRTLTGGSVVIVALLLHLGWQFRHQSQLTNLPSAD